MEQETILKEILTALKLHSENVNSRFDQFDNRMDSLEGRMDKLENRMESLETRVDKLEDKVDAGFAEVNKRLDRHEKKVD